MTTYRLLLPAKYTKHDRQKLTDIEATPLMDRFKGTMPMPKTTGRELQITLATIATLMQGAKAQEHGGDDWNDGFGTFYILFMVIIIGLGIICTFFRAPPTGEPVSMVTT